MIIDQMNRTIRVASKPMRIVSLVPSQTELLFDLELDERVVGITKFCIHPESWFKSKVRVGGTKKLDYAAIHALKPDLIIGNKEENTKEDIEYLENFYPVWMSDIYSLEDALEMMLKIGELCQAEEKAKQLVHEIQTGFNTLIPLNKSDLPRKSVVYLIWKNPYYAAAKNTFIDDMLQRCGLENFFQQESRYPEWNPSTSQAPDFIFLSSEPFPFAQKDLQELHFQFPQAHIQLVDGEMFSWYGSRLLKSVQYFKALARELER